MGVILWREPLEDKLWCRAPTKPFAAESLDVAVQFKAKYPV